MSAPRGVTHAAGRDDAHYTGNASLVYVGLMSMQQDAWSPMHYLEVSALYDIY